MLSLNRKQNKGEWSEAYCIFKIISDAFLQTCDNNLHILGEPIVVKGGKIKDIDYFIKDKNVSFQKQSCEIINIPSMDISQLADMIKYRILHESNKTFQIDDVSQFLNHIGVTAFKGNAGEKCDAVFKLFDNLTCQDEELSFTIKSFLGASPTLINASGATNFIYSVNLKSDCDIKNLKAKTLLRHLHQNNNIIQYIGTQSDIYQSNLEKIDLCMPQIIAEALKIYFSSKMKTISDIVRCLEKENPLNLKDTSLYQYKFQEFLFFSSLGLFPKKKWEGRCDIDGGCIIVKSNGDIVTFYIFRKEFMKFYRDYLYNHCFFDTASTTRHKFGIIYRENEIFKLKLNLQIRIKA